MSEVYQAVKSKAEKAAIDAERRRLIKLLEASRTSSLKGIPVEIFNSALLMGLGLKPKPAHEIEIVAFSGRSRLAESRGSSSPRRGPGRYKER